jgi:uncharacterized membrane protein YqjE
MGGSGPGGGRRTDEVTDASTSELVQRLGEQVSRLVREELRLARAELADKGKRAGIGAGLLGGGGLVALYGIAAVLAGLILLLAQVMWDWLAAVIVGVVLLAVAGVMALQGRTKVREATPPIPEQATDSVRADIDEISARARQ